MRNDKKNWADSLRREYTKLYIELVKTGNFEWQSLQAFWIAIFWKM